MDIITIMTMMCPYFKEKHKHAEILSIYFKYVSTHSVYSETYFQTFCTKLRYLNKYEGEKKRKEREVTTLGNLVRRDYTFYYPPFPLFLFSE